MAIAAMSQYASTLEMPDSSGIVMAMMDDASDGVMNGMMGGNMQTNAGTSGLASAMTTFIGTPSVNRSGVTTTDMNALITKLQGSSGTIQ